MITNEEIKARLMERLIYVQKEIDATNKDLGDPIKHHHYLGYLQALDGMFGERQFLERMIDEIG